MKPSHFLRAFLSVIILGFAVLTQAALAGSSAGNGGDIVPPNFYHAWFGGTKSVPSYCYSVAPDFGVPAQRLEETVEWAFNEWVKYLELKKLTGIKLAQKLSRQSKCDGTESMRIYFGTSDALTDKLKLRYQSPIAFSEKTEYDVHTGQGRGVIWLSAPKKFGWSTLDWTKPENLRAILLHEMGHVFGNGHINETIMDEDLGHRVLGDGGHSGAAANLPLTTIDGKHRELVQCDSCTYEFICGGHAQLQTRFAKLLGKAPVGEATAVLRLKEGRRKTGVLTLKDDMGSYAFPIAVEKDILWKNGERTAFVHTAGSESSSGGIGTGSGVWFGSMQTPSGKSLPVSLSRGLSYSAEVVDLDGEVLKDREDDSDFFHGHSFKVVP